MEIGILEDKAPLLVFSQLKVRKTKCMENVSFHHCMKKWRNSRGHFVPCVFSVNLLLFAAASGIYVFPMMTMSRTPESHSYFRGIDDWLNQYLLTCVSHLYLLGSSSVWRYLLPFSRVDNISEQLLDPTIEKSNQRSDAQQSICFIQRVTAVTH
jgi:hypothetical protein